MRHAFWVVSLWALAASCLAACGGKVVYKSGEPEGGEDPGTGGSEDPGPECVLACGEPCTKCVGSDCFTGECSGAGVCMPPENPPVCDL